MGIRFLILLLAAAVTGMPCGAFAQSQQMGQGNSLYEILNNDHKVITADFNEVKQAADDEQKKKAFDTLKRDLIGHMRAEESHWYPVLQENEQTKGMAIQAKDEHLTARTELEKISANWKTEPPRLELAEKMVNDHVKSEEGRMFDASRKVIGGEQEQKIADEIRKAEGAG